MRITFYAHACFRLEHDRFAIVTDPYTPGPGGSNFDPVEEPADVVVMSSDDDPFHSDPSHVSGSPPVVRAESPAGMGPAASPGDVPRATAPCIRSTWAGSGCSTWGTWATP